jgi:hypothetical protein
MKQVILVEFIIAQETPDSLKQQARQIFFADARGLQAGLDEWAIHRDYDVALGQLELLELATTRWQKVMLRLREKPALQKLAPQD